MKKFGAYLKTGNMTSSEGFFVQTKGSFADILANFKKNPCGMGGKEPLLGRVDGFQIRPCIASCNIIIPRGY